MDHEALTDGTTQPHNLICEDGQGKKWTEYIFSIHQCQNNDKATIFISIHHF